VVNTDSILGFGEYRLDPVSGHLYQRSTTVPLTPKAFALLHYLARHQGRLIPKRELLDAVWPGVFVGDAVLKTAIRDLRRTLNDDPQTPRFIETAHRRGYRFVAPVAVGESGAIPAAPHPHPRVSYARSGSVNIAYQVVGDGPVDLVFVMGWVSHLEYFWNEPSFARFLDRLAGMSRLILFDKRGTGLSDPVPVTGLPTLEQRLDDVRAVMEAAGSARAVLLGVSEGGPLCSLFAATYPERTEALIMIGSYARRLWAPEYPWGPSLEDRERFCRTIIDEWGGPVGIEERAPSKASDAPFRDWWAAYLRMGASPGAAVALTRMNAEIDIRDVLPSIRVPTLVLHRTGDRCLKVEEGRYLASRIPGATFIELPGDDHLPFVGDQEAMLGPIEQFLSRTRTASDAAHVLASVLTVRLGAAARSRDPVVRTFEREVAGARGRLLRVAEDRLLAAFDGPGRAVQCGMNVVSRASALGLDARGGVHVGECQLGACAGPPVEGSAALADAAPSGEVYVSRTVVDLVPGSGLRFEERGVLDATEAARGMPLYAVSAPAP
jgi:pimeloyl-ACP methyl ester carboxylesterase